MPNEIPSIEKQREDATNQQRRALELQGWRPLPDIVYTHIVSWGDNGFETQPIKTLEKFRQEILEEYEDDGFDEVTFVPTDVYEKNPQSFYAYIRNKSTRIGPEKPEEAKKEKEAA